MCEWGKSEEKTYLPYADDIAYTRLVPLDEEVAEWTKRDSDCVKRELVKRKFVRESSAWYAAATFVCGSFFAGIGQGFVMPRSNASLVFVGAMSIVVILTFVMGGIGERTALQTLEEMEMGSDE